MISNLLSRFAQPLLIVALLALAGLLVKAGITNFQLERQVKAAEKAVTAAQEAAKAAEDRFDDLVRDYNEQARAHDAREAALLAERDEAIQLLRTTYETRIGAVDRSLQLALDGLRHSADADRRRALRPAADAAAACRDHAASPTQLALPDAEVALRIAADGDRAAVRLAAAQQYIADVCLRQGVTQ